ncbi:mucin-13 [Leptosomus discolor]
MRLCAFLAVLLSLVLSLSKGDFCKPDPCGENLAKCVALYSTFTCLCPYGFYYNNKDCHRGKIYPGVITLEGFYTNNVETVNSMEYEKVFQYVMEFGIRESSDFYTDPIQPRVLPSVLCFSPQEQPLTIPLHCVLGTHAIRKDACFSLLLLLVRRLFQDAFKDLEGFGQTVIVGIRLSMDVIEWAVVTVAVDIGPLLIWVDAQQEVQLKNRIATAVLHLTQGDCCPAKPNPASMQTLKETRASSSMHVTVTNLFMENSTVEKETVSSAIRNATENSTYVSDYRDETYCAAFNCDAQTTVCEGDMFPECTCRPDFSKTEWDDRSCSDCSKDCSAEQNKYCVKENGIPTCKCMSNFEWKNEKCVSCPVGYSGENCSDSKELILIIVGTVFGAIILMLVIAVSVVSVRAKHKQDPEKMNLIKSGYSNPNTSDDRQTMMFPRVQTTSGHANPGYQPNNPYEMPSANRGHFPERDYDDLYEISKEPEGFRRQNRH